MKCHVQTEVGAQLAPCVKVLHLCPSESALGALVLRLPVQGLAVRSASGATALQMNGTESEDTCVGMHTPLCTRTRLAVRFTGKGPLSL